MDSIKSYLLLRTVYPKKIVTYQELRCLKCSLKAKFCLINAGNTYFKSSNSIC